MAGVRSLLGLGFAWVASFAAANEVRLCFNEQLPSGDEPHVSLLLVREAAPPGVDVRLTPLPWRRCVLATERGEFDGAVGLIDRADRPPSLWFPDDLVPGSGSDRRLFRLPMRLLRRVGSNVRWDGKALNGASSPVGVERGHATAELLRDRGLRVDTSAGNIDALVAMIRAERVDAIVVSEPQWRSIARQAPQRMAGLEAAGPPVAYLDYHLVFHVDWINAHRGAADEWWSGIARVRRTETFRARFAAQNGDGDGRLPDDP